AIRQAAAGNRSAHFEAASVSCSGDRLQPLVATGRATSTIGANPAKMRPMFSITPKHDFLVGIDSDGCVFDSMEIKYKECFIPNFINHYGLQGVSKFAREAA